MRSETLIVLLISGGAAVVMLASFVGIVLLFARRSARGVKSLPQQAAALASSLGVQADAAGNFSFPYVGQTFSFAIQWGKGPVRSSLFTRIGDSQVPALESTLRPFQPAQTRGDVWGIVLRRETALDKLGKWLFINREVQTGSREFDDRVYVETSAPDDVVQAVLSNPQVKRLVPQILALGFSHVIIAPSAGIAASNEPPRLTGLTPEAVMQSAAHLAELGRCIPTVRPPSARPPLLTWRGLVVLSVYLAAIAAFASVILADAQWTTLDSTIHWVGAGIGAALLFPAIPFLGLLLRGRSNSLRLLLTAMVPLFAVLPVLSTASLVAINGIFDSSTPKRRVCEVRDMRVSSGKSTSYHLDVASWRKGEETISFNVSRKLYDQINAARRAGVSPRVAVVQHDGALGAAWFSAIGPAVVGE